MAVPLVVVIYSVPITYYAMFWVVCWCFEVCWIRTVHNVIYLLRLINSYLYIICSLCYVVVILSTRVSVSAVVDNETMLFFIIVVTIND